MFEFVARQTEALVFVELREQVPQSEVAVSNVVEEELERIAKQRSSSLATLHEEVTVGHVPSMHDRQLSLRFFDLNEKLLEVLIHFNPL